LKRWEVALKQLVGVLGKNQEGEEDGQTSCGNNQVGDEDPVELKVGIQMTSEEYGKAFQGNEEGLVASGKVQTWGVGDVLGYVLMMDAKMLRSSEEELMLMTKGPGRELILKVLEVVWFVAFGLDQPKQVAWQRMLRETLLLQFGIEILLQVGGPVKDPQKMYFPLETLL
jgi:hypothetical protein